jgi:hypothetical protein
VNGIGASRLSTVDAGIVVYRAGRVSGAKLIAVLDRQFAIVKPA